MPAECPLSTLHSREAKSLIEVRKLQHTMPDCGAELLREKVSLDGAALSSSRGPVPISSTCSHPPHLKAAPTPLTCLVLFSFPFARDLLHSSHSPPREICSTILFASANATRSNPRWSSTPTDDLVRCSRLAATNVDGEPLRRHRRNSHGRARSPSSCTARTQWCGGFDKILDPRESKIDGIIIYKMKC